ncbi:hypothetical protein PT974_06990 [Cladobotryum mycophilum]|uniref:Nudix hydrolase domain-containing protein n=1 Tax=Cladobotryum mycophilum TaxID=491253 RepID=A0ABR0SP51_9HYPO
MASTKKLPIPVVIGTRDTAINYTRREAVRAVVVNAWGHIAILYSRRDNYYKLPGGGIEPGENHHAAVEREVKEETGALVRVFDVGCVAIIEEFRDTLHQFSYLYLAETVNDVGEPKLTPEEIQDDLLHWWSPPADAMRVMEIVEPRSDIGRSIKDRDLYLLQQGMWQYKNKVAIPQSEMSGFPVDKSGPANAESPIEPEDMVE